MNLRSEHCRPPAQPMPCRLLRLRSKSRERARADVSLPRPPRGHSALLLCPNQGVHGSSEIEDGCETSAYDAGTLLQHTTPQIIFCYRKNIVSIWIQEYGFMQYTQSCGIWRRLVAWPRASDCSYLFHVFLYVFHIFSTFIPYLFIIFPHSGNHEIHVISICFPHVFHIYGNNMETIWKLYEKHMGLLPKPTQNQPFGALHFDSARRPECPCKVPDSKRSLGRGILKSYRNHISRFPGNHFISIFKPSKK